jgi:hypothetical protein
MTPARFRWGMFLILFGLLLMFWNLGYLNSNWTLQLVYWFPVLLIAIGIEKIFTRSQFQFVSYVTTVALFAGGLYIAFASSSGGVNSSYFSDTTYEKEYDPSVTEVSAVVDIGDGRLRIRDATDELVYGKFAQFTPKPKIDYRINGSTAQVEFRQHGSSLLAGGIEIKSDGPNDFDDWMLKFSELVPLSLECRGDQANIHLSLATTPLKRLDLDAADSRVYVKIGDMQPLVELSLLGADADIRLRVPRDAGIRVHGSGYDALLEQIGLIRVNDVHQSEDFEAGTPKIDVDLDDRLRSLSIDTY